VELHVYDLTITVIDYFKINTPRLGDLYGDLNKETDVRQKL